MAPGKPMSRTKQWFQSLTYEKIVFLNSGPADRSLSFKYWLMTIIIKQEELAFSRRGWFQKKLWCSIADKVSLPRI